MALPRVCFVADTPVVTGVLTPPLMATTTSTDGDNKFSGTWIACGIASLAAGYMLLSNERSRRRTGRKFLHLDSANAPPDSNPLDFDVSEVDFDSVCEELLLGCSPLRE